MRRTEPPRPHVNLDEEAWVLGEGWREEAVAALEEAREVFKGNRWANLSGYVAALERHLMADREFLDETGSHLAGIFRGTWAAEILLLGLDPVAVPKSSDPSFSSMSDGMQGAIILYEHGEGDFPLRGNDERTWDWTKSVQIVWSSLVRSIRNGEPWDREEHRLLFTRYRMPAWFERAQGDTAAIYASEASGVEFASRSLWLRLAAAHFVEGQAVRSPGREATAVDFVGWVDQKNKGGAPRQLGLHTKRMQAVVDVLLRRDDSGFYFDRDEEELPESQNGLYKRLADRGDIGSHDAIKQHFERLFKEDKWEKEDARIDPTWLRLAHQFAEVVDRKRGGERSWEQNLMGHG